MTYFEDLTPYSYLEVGEAALKVGWPGRGHPFPTGQADDGTVIEVLRLVRDNPVNQMRGRHDCEFCERSDDPAKLPDPVQMDLDGLPAFPGHCEIRVRARTRTIYAAPSLLAPLHVCPRYLPPPDFLRALSPVTG